MLLEQPDNPYDTNGVDSKGHTPLTLFLQGISVKMNFYNELYPQSNIFMVLVAHGADVNFVYPE
jgi:hypothetical protein